MIEELITKYVAPFQSPLPEFCVSLLGVLGTVSYFVPEDSKLGKLLHTITNGVVKLKDLILKKK